MIQKLNKNGALFGLIFTVAVALLTVALSSVAYIDPDIYARMQAFLFDCGVDAIGALGSAGLFYGCMKQKGEGTEAFRVLNLLVSAGFAVNFLLYFTMGVPASRPDRKSVVRERV